MPPRTIPYFAIGLTYLTGYVVLDFVSFVYPYAAYGITPWNPTTGLSFALVLLFGRTYLPWLFVAPLAADALLRELPLPLTAEILMVVTSGLGYGAAALFLSSPTVGFDRTVATRQSLLWLMAVAPFSFAAVAVGHSAVLLTYGIISVSRRCSGYCASIRRRPDWRHNFYAVPSHCVYDAQLSRTFFGTRCNRAAHDC